MELTEPQSDEPSARRRIIQELTSRGIPLVEIDQVQLQLVSILQSNESLLAEAVSVILPRLEKSSNVDIVESLLWLQWLMFESEPRSYLEHLAEKAADQRALCGAVWGKNELAYHCRTCEKDSTCAICVPCFQNGNHKDHDYSIIRTEGGCCDCGDITAWDQDGFCSKHKGIDNIQQALEDFPCSLGPVLDALLLFWSDNLFSLEALRRKKNHGEDNQNDFLENYTNEITKSIVDMLLGFANCSENLICFVSKRISLHIELLRLLVEAEVFLHRDVVPKLHELLLKLQVDPVFKYEFAKTLIRYYPHSINKAAEGNHDSEMPELSPLLASFSVQIFTVPSLALRLVKEADLFRMLQECLGNIFHSCMGKDGCLQVVKLNKIFETMCRVIADIRFTLSHVEVPKYVVLEQPDAIKKWIKILGHIQGIDPQKRVTGLHIEEEEDNSYRMFYLEHCLHLANDLLIEGAFSVVLAEPMRKEFPPDFGESDKSLIELSEMARRSGEKSDPLVGSGNSIFDFALPLPGVHLSSKQNVVPQMVASSISESLRAIDEWLEPEAAQNACLHAPEFSGGTMSHLLHLPKYLFKTRKKSSSKVVGRRRGFRQFPRGERSGGTSKSLYDSNVAMTIDSDRQDASVYSMDSDNHSMEIDSEIGLYGVQSSTDWQEITFDVSSGEISFHLPLHRFVSIALQKGVKRHCSGNHVSEVAGEISVSPSHKDDFISCILKGIHPYAFSSWMMEHPLRLRVFCAQVRSGMWRRNGDMGILLSDQYHNVHWTSTGIEVDLFLLQCCAAVAPPDLFVGRILERFALSSYLSLNIAEFNEYETVLVQEMLTLLIQIVKERRFCGFSTSENLQRELVHKLVVGDATRSQLLKALPYELSKVKGIQLAVDSLTTFTKPSGMKQGIFSLRKEHWKLLDLYHPRWNIRDLQVAEERYQRFCQVSPLFVQVPSWTKVYSPLSSIGKIATSKTVLQIIRAVLFYAVYSEKPSTCRAPDDVLIRALHLLSLSLGICEMCSANQTESDLLKLGGPLSGDGFPILSHATETISTRIHRGSSGPTRWVQENLLSLLVALTKKHKKENHTLSDSGGPDLSSLIEDLLKRLSQLSAHCRRELDKVAPGIFVVGQCGTTPDADKSESDVSFEDRKAKARKRQAAILEKMKAEQSKFISSLNYLDGDFDSPKSGAEDAQMTEQNQLITSVCSLCHNTDTGSPLSIIVLLQRSRLASLTDEGTPSWEDIAEYGCQYTSPDTVGYPLTDDQMSSEASSINELDIDDDLLFIETTDHQHAAADGNSSNLQTNCPSMVSDSFGSTSISENDLFTFILKDMDRLDYDSFLEKITGQPLCPFAFGGSVNRKKNFHAVELHEVASLCEPSHCCSSSSSLGVSTSSPTSASTSSKLPLKDRFGPLGCDGIFISSCGHAVHQRCHDRYISTMKQRGLDFGGRHLVDPSKGEFFCPACRRFANSILPLFSSEFNSKGKNTALPSSCFFSVGDSSIRKEPNGNWRFHHALSLLLSCSRLLKEKNISNIALHKVNGPMEQALEPSILKLCELYVSSEDNKSFEIYRANNSFLLWDTLRYSIISTEIATRGKKGVQCEDSVFGTEILSEELRSSNGVSLNTLLHAAQVIRGLNHLQVQLRFKSVQCFTSSIFISKTGDTAIAKSDCLLAGTKSLSLEDKENVVFTRNFLNVAADPILVHDPFSSLMWLLFSLPLPFVSSMECLLSLVHLFHAVCVVQALITCYGNHKFDASTIGSCFLVGLCKDMGNFEPVQKLFVSRYIDGSCKLEDMVRRLTVPFLRRCALLWNLLELPMAADGIDDCSRVTKCGTRSKYFPASGSYCNTEFAVVELENMFHICSLDVICNDKVVQALASDWSEHLCQYIRKCGQANILYCNPAVPFRLVRLPLLYQDLLERYNKERCPDCNGVQKESALCLFCGRICFPNMRQSCSCRERRCLVHSKRCGAGFGAFLLINNTSVLLQSSSRQLIWPSPYLDAFGEEDVDVRRGKPLYLSQERYAALTNMIASHGIDRSSEVLRHPAIAL